MQILLDMSRPCRRGFLLKTGMCWTEYWLERLMVFAGGGGDSMRVGEAGSLRVVEMGVGALRF